MADVSVGQELFLNITDREDRDMSLEDIRIDFWKPDNKTGTPSGTIPIGDITTTAGSPLVVAKVAKGTIDVPSSGDANPWRFQMIDNVSGVTWTVMAVPVDQLGA